MTETHREEEPSRIARIVAHATQRAQQPEWFSTAPVGAVSQALQQDRLECVKDVDLWEVNEAFAVVPTALMHEPSTCRTRQRQRASAAPARWAT